MIILRKKEHSSAGRNMRCLPSWPLAHMRPVLPGREALVPRAMPLQNDFPLATCGVRQLTELGVAQGPLGNNDCHFGRSGRVNVNTIQMHRNWQAVQSYGPRAADAYKRGGIVAEMLWDEWNEKPNEQTYSNALKQFLITFDEVGRNKVHEIPGNTNSPSYTVRDATAPKNELFPNNAFAGKYSEVSNDRRYKSGAQDKTMNSIHYDLYSQDQRGARWSKVALEATLVNKGLVHFHLDGMGDIEQLLNKQGHFNFGCTTRELRYVKRNWNRFKDHTIFYNGFVLEDNSHYPMQVEKPWN